MFVFFERITVAKNNVIHLNVGEKNMVFNTGAIMQIR